MKTDVMGLWGFSGYTRKFKKSTTANRCLVPPVPGTCETHERAISSAGLIGCVEKLVMVKSPFPSCTHNGTTVLFVTCLGYRRRKIITNFIILLAGYPKATNCSNDARKSQGDRTPEK